MVETVKDMDTGGGGGGSSNNSSTDTYVVQPDPKRDITYVRCASTGPIPEPYHTHHKTAQLVNDTELQLFLGVPFLQRSKNRITLKFINLLFTLFLVEYWEQYLYDLYNTIIPEHIKRTIIYQLWHLYFPVHRYCFNNRTGIHPHASEEYHALTTAMYLFRFLPNSIVRMRFALRQLTSCQPSAYCTKSGHSIERIDTDYLPSSTTLLSSNTTTPASSNGTAPTTTIAPPERQKDFCRVKGLYIRYHDNDTPPTEYTLFWLYGGAFLAGDCDGNVGPADTIAYHSQQMDVFIPEYRLAPESQFDDIVWDVVLAYRYLYDLRRSRQQDPKKIVLFGCSSGAALCIRLMQFISEIQQEQYDKILPSYVQLVLDGSMMPSGAVLASPYLDYSADLDPHGSFVQYSCHDLIVTEAVQEVGLPFLNSHMGPSGNRTVNSPFSHTFQNLPPLCVIVSQHETVYDESIRFIHAARSAGVPVTVGLWKYMCHVFLFFNGFIPEARQAMDFISTWYKDHINAKLPDRENK